MNRMPRMPSMVSSGKRSMYWGGRRLLGAHRFPPVSTLQTTAGGPRLARLPGRVIARATRVHPPVTEDLAEWCDRHGLERLVLSPAQTRRRAAPLPVGATHPNFDQRLVAEIAERFLVCIPDARLWGTNGLVVLPDGSYAAEAIYGRSHLVHDRAYSTPLPARVVSKRGDYFSLLGEFSNSGNYYHWIHDGLLRLHGVRAHLPREVTYLIPPTLAVHQRETLHMLGLDDDQLVPFPMDEAWQCERLWFASLPPSGAEVEDAVRWLRGEMLAAAGVDRPEPRRRFYLSRAHVAHARVVNEPELLPVLDRHGFEIVEPQRLSVTEQIRRFSDAAVIAAPTGAGLANLLFASRESKNLEILEPVWAADKAFVVWTLAETLGQRYWYVMGETVARPEHPKRADLRISPETFDHAMRTVLDAS